MTKKIAATIVTLLAVSLLAGCSSFQEKGPIAYSGTGDIVEYHANGKIKRKTEYMDGELVSVVSFYASGTEEFTELYTSGELHDATYYFASGRVKTEIRGK